MWRAMRQLRIFDASTIAMVTESATETAREFLTILSRAGFVVSTGGGSYRLLVSSGPKAPIVRQGPRRSGVAFVIDANDGRVCGLDGRKAPTFARPVNRWSKLRLKPPRRSTDGQSTAARRLAELLGAR